jgi:dUTP pyrophosphatase
MHKVHILYLRDAAALYGEGLAYATPDSAGMDLRACIESETLTIGPGQRAPVPSGICIEPRVPGVAGFIYSRSGLGAVKGLTVAQGVGVIDADYRGEVMVALHNHSGESRTIDHGERIAQLVLVPYLTAVYEQADSLTDTVRGEGGFGSTGSK